MESGILYFVAGMMVTVILFLLTTVIIPLRSIRKDVRDVKKKIDAIHERPILFSQNLFLAALAREARFWEKLYIQRSDKVLIASKIASKYIGNNNKTIVDSGTTVDQIPHILLGKGVKATIYTNNLLAAISMLPPVEDFECFLLGGKIDMIFGATYNRRDIGKPLEPIEANRIVLAAVSITYNEGPMVNAQDESNRTFKAKLVEKALKDEIEPQLIIAVDWTKFGYDTTSNLNAVLDPRVWKAVRATSRFVLVATKPPKDMQREDAIKAREEIELFNGNMKEGGMKVDICEAC